MSIYISNSLYLGGGLGADFNENNPIIGYHSILVPSDFTASSPVANRPAANMWTPDTSSVWEGNPYSGAIDDYEETIELSNSANRVVNYIGIAKHNFGDGGYTYVLQYSTDAGATWDDLTTPRIVGNNNAIVDYFDDQTYGLFRIKLTKTAAEVLAPIIAHVKLGEALVLQRRIFVGHKPATIAKKVKKIVNGSENGQYLGQEIVRSYYTSDCQQNNNTPEFVRENVKPFIDHINGDVVVDGSAPSSFFFAWRPSDYPTEVVYGWTSDNIEPENERTNGMMKWSFSMECVA